MMVMNEGALGFQKSLELVGDAAAATGQPVENLAHEVGRAYAIIRDGQPLSRATMGLRNMGAITPEVAARLEELQKSGASNIEIWNELEAALGKFKGAMKETEQTGDGLMGAISAQWDDAARSFGSAFMDAAKGGLSLVLEKLKRLNEDGSVVKWANTAAKAAVAVKDAFASVGEGVARVSSALGAAFGALESGGGAKGAWRAFRDDVQYGYDNRKHGEELQRTLDAQQADTAAKLAAALKGANAGEGREGGEAAGDDAERARIERQMAEQQAKADAQREWEAAGRDMDKRAHDDQLAEEFLEQVRKDDEEMERKLREQRKRLLEEEFSQRKRELEAAQTAMDGGMTTVSLPSIFT